VVNPPFFPGGDIGKLAICGTINDLSMRGAKPLYLTVGLIIEEGFPLSDLETITTSMATTANEAGVQIVAGDTKVVEKGSADRIFINTAGIGMIPEGINVSGANARPGDKIILSGTLGDHGIAILSCREGLTFRTTLESDCAPLNQLVGQILQVCPHLHCLRDPTRGGLATTLNELAIQSQVGMVIEEAHIPIREEVRGACEMLGLDPLYLANEGKLVAIVPASETDKAVEAMLTNPWGQEAQVIGEVRASPPGMVLLKTEVGSTRILDMLSGELLPRIC
jgi:hydrogenase expression/formation protein HypE